MLRPYAKWKRYQQLSLLITVWKQDAEPLVNNHRNYSPLKICEPPSPNTLTEEHLKKGVLYGTTPSAAWDTACTTNAGKIVDPFIQIDYPSKKIFALADGHPTAGSNVAKLHHNVREPSRMFNVVPALEDNSLLSGAKFSDAGYISICDGSEVNFYDGCTVKISVSEEVVLRGWR